MTEQAVAERLDPTVLPENWWELSCHLWRYEYSAAQPNLGVVADCACGLGYGTALLAKAGYAVRGFDKDADTLTACRYRYGMDAVRLGFSQVDMMDETFAMFNTLVSFETLEHLDDPWHVLQRLASSVTTLIASVPIVRTTHYNPHHRHNFTAHSFRSLIRHGRFRILEEHFQSAPTRANVYLVVKAVR